MRRRKRGFTLIELLTTLSIIALLVAIIIPRLVKNRYRAYFSACLLNSRNVATALESYRTDNHDYPATLNVLVGSATVSKLPSCPSAPGSAYIYEVSGDGQIFTLSCPGLHEAQIPNHTHGFPQYVAGEGLHEHNTP